ncbi:MAG: glycosyltransferase [Patescibacteria group bacterium]|nr:glycosyltransferase [Patescibacteria group bacterium]
MITIVTPFYSEKEKVFIQKNLRTLSQVENMQFHYVLVYMGRTTDRVYREIKDAAESYDFVTCLCTPESKGISFALNKAIDSQDGEYIYISHPDIDINETTIQSLADILGQASEVGVIAPQLVYEDGGVQDVYRRFPNFVDMLIKRSFLRRFPGFKNRYKHYLMWDKNPDIIEDVDWVTFHSVMIRRSTYAQAGGFDQQYYLYMYDTDFCQQVWSQGQQVLYYPRLVAMQYRKRDSDHKGLIYTVSHKKSLYHVVSAFKYFAKYLLTAHPRMQQLEQRRQQK